MVKFQMRLMKKRYKKNKEYSYRRYFIEFPARLNQKIEPHAAKNFEDADITSKDVAGQEIVNISLVRNKRPPQQKN